MRRLLAAYLFILFVPLPLMGQESITLAFIGDVMQHQRQLDFALKKGADTLDPASYDYSSYFRYTGEILSKADFSVANMEFVCGHTPYTGYPSFSAPASLAKECKDAGIDLFLCANNHIFDKGQKGLERTLQVYDSLGVPHIGVYTSRAEQLQSTPFIADIKGVRFAFVNFTYGTNTAALRGVVERMDSTNVLKSIDKAREAEADFIIALPHWGTEYSTKPSAQQKNWENFLYDNGVDVIIGSHPHVIQPINTIRDNSGEIRHITAYSLGNYISNMSAKNTQAGFIFVLEMEVSEEKPRIVSGKPVWLWCARGGRFESNYTTLPIEDFINKPEMFPIRYEYDNMVETYNRLKEDIEYDN